MATRGTRKRWKGAQLDDLRRRCETGKVSYFTYDEAIDGAEKLMHMGHVHPGCHIVPYQCDRCPNWHVTNRKINFPKGWMKP